MSRTNYYSSCTSGMLHETRESMPTPLHDHPDWHRGREDYSVWLVRLDGSEVFRKIEAAREHLSDFLLRPYQRQPHITIFVCGFLAEISQHNDDYSTEQFNRHLQLLKEGAGKPFTLEVGRLNSFASAPFLEVADPEGGLDRLRSLLLTTGEEIGRSGYTPHITVGLYSGAYPSSMVMEKIASFPEAVCSVRVDRVTFATYRAQEISGTLTYRHEVLLGRDEIGSIQ